MPLSQFARDQSLEYMFTAASLLRPTTWYVACFSAFPGDAGGSSYSNELTSGSDPGYARVQLTGGNALALSSHIIENGGSVTIGPATGTWAAVSWMGIMDASSSGNLWDYIELSQSGATFFLAGGQFANPGSGYAINDVITLTSGGGATLTVDAVATVNGVAGVVTQFHVSARGSLSSIPSNPMATTDSGSGTGFTFLATWLLSPQSFQLNSGDSITIATAQLTIAAA